MTVEPKREYRVAAHPEGYVVQNREVGSRRWTEGPIFLSREKAEDAMRRLAGLDDDGSPDNDDC
jgi:hypothetical protein